MKRFANRVARMLVVGIVAVFTVPAVAQQAYPSKSIRLIAPYPAGGTFTVLGRLIGQKLTESWGQQVLLDNRPGGNTIIGTDALAKSAGDGYTLLLAGSTHVTLPNLYDKLPFDAINDFAAVATVVRQEVVLALHPSVPASNLQEFIALAKSKPGQLNYASGGSGTGTHLPAALLEMLAGVKMQHIPYKGGAPALTDLLGGQVQMSFLTPIVAIPHVKTGKVKAIAVSGESRLSALPDVPTFSEGGLRDFHATIWIGVLAPARTPKPIIDKLSAEINKILALPDVVEQLASLGVGPFISTPEQFAAMMKADLSRYAKVIETANIKLE